MNHAIDRRPLSDQELLASYERIAEDPRQPMIAKGLARARITELRAQLEGLLHAAE